MGKFRKWFKLSLLGFSLLAIGFGSLFLKRFERKSESKSSSSTSWAPACWLDPVDRQGDLSWDELQNFVQTRDPRTIEDLIPLLGNHRDYWTLLYRSRSPEAVLTDENNPRVVAFGKSGTLLISFNGCSLGNSNSSYPRCENMQVLDRKSDSLTVPHLIRLPGKFAAPGERAEIMEAPQLDQLPREQRCISCHRTNVAPNWEPYNIWPGTCGSHSRGGFDVMKKKSPEAKKCDQFANRIKHDKNSRYAGLTWHFESQVPAGLFDYSNQLKDHDFTKDLSRVEKIKHSAISNPNAMLSRILGEKLNSRRTLFRLVSSPLFEKYKFAIAGVLNGCFADFTLERLLDSAGIPSSPYNKFAKKMKNQFDETVGLENKLAFSDSPIEDGPFNPVINEFSHDRLNLFIGLNIIGAKMGLDLRSSGVGFANRSIYDGHEGMGLALRLSEFAIKCDPELGATTRAAIVKSAAFALQNETMQALTLQNSCGDLEQKSRDVLGDSNLEVTKNTAASDKILEGDGVPTESRDQITYTNLEAPRGLTSCVSCHSNGPGVSIPFADPLALRESLTLTTESGRTLIDEITYRLNERGPKSMPLGTSLDPNPTKDLQMRSALINYFNNVSKIKLP